MFLEVKTWHLPPSTPNFDSLSALLQPTLCLRRLTFEDYIWLSCSVASRVSREKHWQKMEGVGEEWCKNIHSLVYLPFPHALWWWWWWWWGNDGGEGKEEEGKKEGKEKEKKHYHPHQRGKFPGGEMDRDFSQLSCLPSRVEAWIVK